MITIHERRIIIASEKKFNKKKAIIVAVIIAVTLTSCAGCNRLSSAELEEVVSEINSNASATTEISESNSQSETDMTVDGSETKEETESTTTEAATEKPETPATVPTEATTPKPSDTTTTKPSETEATAPAETTTTTTTTAATPQSTETPAPEWTETAVNGTKYVTVDCYSRVKAMVGSERVKLYKTNTEVKVVARTDTGYFKLDNGSFIHGDYLSDSKVNVQIATTTTTQKTEIPNITDTFYSSHSYGSKQYLIDLCEYYGFTEYTEKDRNNVTNYTKMIFETYESGSYEKQLKEYISKYLGKHDGRYEIVYDDVYNVYGIHPYTYIPDSEWRFTKQDCEDILKACEKYAKDNGYGYCKPSDFDTVKGKVYQHSSWAQVYANSPAVPNLRWSGYTRKEKMIGILCEEIQLNYEEGLGATCVDYCLASEYYEWLKSEGVKNPETHTACQDLTAYVFFPCY